MQALGGDCVDHAFGPFFIEAPVAIHHQPHIAADRCSRRCGALAGQIP
jgi:hypothetical protein